MYNYSRRHTLLLPPSIYSINSATLAKRNFQFKYLYLHTFFLMMIISNGFLYSLNYLGCKRLENVMNELYKNRLVNPI